MSVLLRTGVKFLVQLLAGVGIAELLDKVAADKIPAPIAPLSPFAGQTGKPVKILKMAAILAVLAVLATFILRKLKIKILN